MRIEGFLFFSFLRTLYSPLIFSTIHHDTCSQGCWTDPDHRFAPTEVWEVRGADLTLSPKHYAAAGMRHAHRGISLRFPRFISHRTDKSVEDASGPDDVVALYDAQQRRFEGQGAAATKRMENAAAVAALSLIHI